MTRASEEIVFVLFSFNIFFYFVLGESLNNIWSFFSRNVQKHLNLPLESEA